MRNCNRAFVILVPRGSDSFAQQHESRPLARPDFLSIRRLFVSANQFVRFDGESSPSNADLQCIWVRIWARSENRVAILGAD